MRRLHEDIRPLVGPKANLRAVEPDDAGHSPLYHLDELTAVQSHFAEAMHLGLVSQNLANVSSLSGSEQIQWDEVVHRRIRFKVNIAKHLLPFLAGAAWVN